MNHYTKDQSPPLCGFSAKNAEFGCNAENTIFSGKKKKKKKKKYRKNCNMLKVCDPIDSLVPPLHHIKVEILVPEESSYFSHYPSEISGLENVSFWCYEHKRQQKVVNHFYRTYFPMSHTDTHLCFYYPHRSIDLAQNLIRCFLVICFHVREKASSLKSDNDRVTHL